MNDHVDELRAAFRYALERQPFSLAAIVVLAEHLPAIRTLPHGGRGLRDPSAPDQEPFLRALPPGERRPASRHDQNERGIWQRRYWEHTLRDEADFERHADYLHFNPMKHGHVQAVADWPFSSFHRFVRVACMRWTGA